MTTTKTKPFSYLYILLKTKQFIWNKVLVDCLVYSLNKPVTTIYEKTGTEVISL